MAEFNDSTKAEDQVVQSGQPGLREGMRLLFKEAGVDPNATDVHDSGR